MRADRANTWVEGSTNVVARWTAAVRITTDQGADRRRGARVCLA
jgi:hypothetical protein